MPRELDLNNTSKKNNVEKGFEFDHENQESATSSLNVSDAQKDDVSSKRAPAFQMPADAVPVKNVDTPPQDNSTHSSDKSAPQTTPVAPSLKKKKLGFFDRLLFKWHQHVVLNKQKAEARKNIKHDEKEKKDENHNKNDVLLDIPLNKLTPAEKSQLREAEKLFEKGTTTMMDFLAPSAIKFDPSTYMIDGMHAQTFFVYDYPQFLDLNWLSPIINSETKFDISFFLYPKDNAEIMKFLRRKVTQLSAEMSLYQEKGLTRDPYIEAKYQDAENLRNSLARGTEHFFGLSFYYTIYAETEDRLRKDVKNFQNIFGSRLILVKPTFLQMERGFNSCLPIANDQINLPRSMNTEPLSSFFPFVSSTLTSDDGILYGINQHNQSLVIFDRFSLPNANSLILATSGAGKSFAIKLEILRSLMWGVDVIIIDPENEYQDLCEQVGGTYLKMSLSSNQHINPFDLPLPVNNDADDGDLLRNNILSLHGLLSLMMGEMSAEEQGILDKALIQTYAIKGITFDTKNPTEQEPPTMKHLYEVLDSMQGGQNLALRLEKYVGGAYSHFFTEQTNIQLDAGMMVFCVRDLEDQIRPMGMYIILGYIWNRVRSELKKRLLIVDEAWNVLQHEDSGAFLYGLIKRARKYYLGVTTITQDVEDFMKSKYGKPIVTNSSMTLLLKQSVTAVDHLQKVFHLTDGEKNLLTSAPIGIGIFFAGDRHVSLYIHASDYEHDIITSNPQDILNKQQL
jgi:conjugal transfer ATP-binding protein TraC